MMVIIEVYRKGVSECSVLQTLFDVVKKRSVLFTPYYTIVYSNEHFVLYRNGSRVADGRLEVRRKLC